MICSNRCPARIGNTCLICKSITIRCEKSKEYIDKAVKVMYLSRKLDEIAMRYIVDKDLKAKDEWWNKLKEVGK